jgi:enoyl-CoA hydratase
VNEDGRIRTEVDGAVATITIDRPERRNALTRSLVQDLLTAIATVSDDDVVRAVILTGAGGTFCAGTDLNDPDTISPAHDDIYDAMESTGGWWPIVACPKPVIAAVDGAAIGMGAELASHCDVRIASTRARFGWNFVQRGLVPDTGAGTWLLPRQIGVAQAIRILMSGELVRAEAAFSMGYVARVVEPEALQRAARKEADRYLEVSPLSLRLLKRLLYDGLDRPLAAHMTDHIDALRECFASADHREGVAAFLEHRPAKFTGQ